MLVFFASEMKGSHGSLDRLSFTKIIPKISKQIQRIVYYVFKNNWIIETA
jgi:hypothetical protein